MANLSTRIPYLLSLLLIAIPSGIQTSNILLVPAVSKGSHMMVLSNIGHELVRRGHNVTMILSGAYRQQRSDNPEDNLRYVYYAPVLTEVDIDHICSGMTTAGLTGQYISWLVDKMSSDNMDKQLLECDGLLGDEHLMASLHDANFDVAVIDKVNGMYLCPLGEYLKEHFQVPLIAFQNVPARSGVTLLANRSPYNPAYMPEITSGLDNNLPAFSDRFYNTVYSIGFTMITSLASLLHADIRVKYGVSHSSPDLADAELWLLNTHSAFDYPRPFMPNTIAIGGLTTKPASPLDQEWHEFVQSAGDAGVVLFSLGSYAATDIDDRMVALFADAFSRIPQKVIWQLKRKEEQSYVVDIPANVKISGWIPQNDLLAHPQVKAFVYHCGINGVFEAIYHGVPVVGLPLFGDQSGNIARLVSRGMGVKLDAPTLTSDQLVEAINTVISDPSYKTNAMRISRLFHDTPRKPVELAADWIEYTVRHGGAQHLRSAALDLNIFQYLLIDVILFLLTASIIVSVILFYCCRFCIRGCCRSIKMKRE